MTTPESHKPWQKPVKLSADAVIELNQIETPSPTMAQRIPLDQIQLDIETTTENTSQVVKKDWRKRWFARSVVGLAAGAVCMEIYRLLQWGFEQHTGIGSVLSGMVLLALVLGVLLWRQSRRGVEQLVFAEQNHAKARAMLSQHHPVQAAHFCQTLADYYRRQPVYSQFVQQLEQVDAAYSDQEVIRYLVQNTLLEQDAQAVKCIERYSIETGLMVAMSPWATVDIVFVGWRNARMLREIAAIYGIAPGIASHGYVWRRVGHTMVFASLSESAMDMGGELLGTNLLNGVAPRVAQGIGAGLLTARAGHYAMRVCRPLPLLTPSPSWLKRIAEPILQRFAKTGGH